MAAHLADWHPWERYQDFFMSSKTMGGGAILDESHWLDLMLWFFGTPEKLFAKVDKISDLEIETDDNVDT
jgi:predicted dehydrogenase